jgi:hypothetical protein
MIQIRANAGILYSNISIQRANNTKKSMLEAKFNYWESENEGGIFS